MKTYSQFITEGTRYDTWSWVYHPVHGIQAESGFHQHYRMQREFPEFYEDPKDPGKFWVPPAGFAKVDRKKRVVEFHDYASRHPDPTPLKEFLKAVHAVGFKVIEPLESTYTQRKEEDQDW